MEGSTLNPPKTKVMSADNGGFEHEAVVTDSSIIAHITEEPMPTWKTPAKRLVVHKMNITTLMIMAFAELFPKVRQLLGLTDDFGYSMVNSTRLQNEPLTLDPNSPLMFQGVPEGRLKTAQLERAGYRLLISPDGEQSPLEAHLLKTEFTQLFELVALGSGILEEHPSLKPLVDRILRNRGLDLSLNFGEVKNEFVKARREEYIETPNTNRDLSVLLNTLHFGTLLDPPERTEAWRQARRIIKGTVNAAIMGVSGNRLLVPELLPTLSKETHEYLARMFKYHDQCFVMGESRIANEEVVPLGYDFLPYTPKDSPDTLCVTLENLVAGERPYQGVVFLRTYVDDGRHKGSFLLPKVVRKAAREELENNPKTSHLAKCPMITVRYEPQDDPKTIGVHVQTDTTLKRPMNILFIARAIREAEIRNRKDLAPATKKRLLADEAILTATGAPQYTKEKRSHFIVGNNGLNMWSATSPEHRPLPLSQSELNDLIVEAIKGQYRKIGP